VSSATLTVSGAETAASVTANTVLANGITSSGVLTIGSSNQLFISKSSGAPSTAAGDKIVLWPSVNNSDPSTRSAGDFKLGVESGYMSLSAGSGGGFEFYSNGNNVASISSAGNLTLSGSVAVGSGTVTQVIPINETLSGDPTQFAATYYETSKSFVAQGATTHVQLMGFGRVDSRSGPDSFKIRPYLRYCASSKRISSTDYSARLSRAEGDDVGYSKNFSIMGTFTTGAGGTNYVGVDVYESTSDTITISVTGCIVYLEL
jgi:hypothetical protein